MAWLLSGGKNSAKGHKMIRNLKALGLALAAVFALSAVSASSAMAVTAPSASFVAAEYPVSYTGTQDGANHAVTFNGGVGVVTCTSSHFDAIGTFAKSTTYVSLTPTYSGCNTVMGADKVNPTTVTHNGCIYSYTVHEEVFGSMGDEWKGDLDLECPVGVSGIEIHIWDTEAKHENKEATKCTFLVKPQTIKGVVYRNETANGDVTIEGKGMVFTIERTGGTADDCGVGFQTAKYDGNITLDPRNNEEKAIVGKIVTGMP
jgi:hypothetical protein